MKFQAYAKSLTNQTAIFWTDIFRRSINDTFGSPCQLVGVPTVLHHPLFSISILTISICLFQNSATALSTSAQLPAVYPLVNILLPLLNNVYNLLLSLLSIFDTLPPSISCLIPVDLGALETSLLKLYSQALAIVNFLRSLPEYAIGASPQSPSKPSASIEGLLGALVTAITDLADDVLVGIGGGLLPGLLQLVVMVVQTLLQLLL